MAADECQDTISVEVLWRKGGDTSKPLRLSWPTRTARYGEEREEG